MKQISIREFQLHAEQYLKDLPLILTRYNVPVAMVDFPTPQKQVVEVNSDGASVNIVNMDSKQETFNKLKEQFSEPVYDKETFEMKDNGFVVILVVMWIICMVWQRSSGYSEPLEQYQPPCSGWQCNY